MKPIPRIAQTELAILFYSPIAWILLIVLACQVGINFLNVTELLYNGWKLPGRVISFSLTAGYLLKPSGIFETIQQSLYLYIPLLTMGLMSRELSGGTIKLLYSSPVTSMQIIFGKYLSMVIYAFFIIVILFLPVLSMMYTVSIIDIGLVLSGLLGLFLLICAYMAIGLFMSCLTSYQVVAAVATFSALVFLNLVGGIGQNITFINEITYWLSISGRAEELVSGLICSDDVIYFMVVTGMFLSLSILKIHNSKVRKSALITCLQYTAIVCSAMLVGYISSRPSLMTFFDATHNKSMTLSVESQEIMKKLDGPLKITTFCNILEKNFDIGIPKNIKADKKRFKQYLRFKPEIETEYIYYYDSKAGQSNEKTLEQQAKEIALKKRFKFKKLKTPEEVKAVADLSSEEFRFVRLIERASGEKTYLRVYDGQMPHPAEAEISVALKKLIVEPVKVGFITGHGERDAKAKGDQDYSIFAGSLSFRQSMVNQGFDVITLNPDTIDEIPKEINILLIAEMRTPLQKEENTVLQKYIDRGGNMIILTDTRRQTIINPLLRQFGVEAMDGMIVQPSDNYPPSLITSMATKESVNFAPVFKTMFENRIPICITMPGAVALRILEKKDFDVLPLLTSPAGKSWVELQTANVTEEPFSLDTLKNEKTGAYITAVAATRKLNDKEQRIFIAGDADCISNVELMLQNRAGIISRNYALITSSFRWLSNGEFPISVNRPPNQDTTLRLEKWHLRLYTILYIWLIPSLLGIAGLCTWLRRRRK